MKARGRRWHLLGNYHEGLQQPLNAGAGGSVGHLRGAQELRERAAAGSPRKALPARSWQRAQLKAGEVQRELEL